jgi:hypothetical protein
MRSSSLPELLEGGHLVILFLRSPCTKEKAPRRALLFHAEYYLVSIATHDPEEGQEVGEDVVDV